MARRRTRRRGGSPCVLAANAAHQIAIKKCGQALGVASKYLSAAKSASPIAKSYNPKKAIGSLKGRWNPTAKAAGRRRRRRKSRRRSRSRSRKRRKSRRRRRRSRRR